MALSVPGTTPAYWLAAEDRDILTMLDELARRAAAADRAQKGARRGHS